MENTAPTVLDLDAIYEHMTRAPITPPYDAGQHLETIQQRLPRETLVSYLFNGTINPDDDINGPYAHRNLSSGYDLLHGMGLDTSDLPPQPGNDPEAARELIHDQTLTLAKNLIRDAIHHVHGIDPTTNPEKLTFPTPETLIAALHRLDVTLTATVPEKRILEYEIPLTPQLLDRAESYREPRTLQGILDSIVRAFDPDDLDYTSVTATPSGDGTDCNYLTIN